jgi:hypothetical protein
MRKSTTIAIILELGAAVAAVVILFTGILFPDPWIMAGLGMIALAAAVVSMWTRRLDFLTLSQFMYCLPLIVIALAGSGKEGMDIGLARAAFLFSLSVSIAISLGPMARSLVETIVGIRRFPAWFKATDLYRLMDAIYGIAWSALLLVSAVLLYLRLEAPVRTILAICGIGSELLVFALLQSHGYRYLDFLTGAAKGKTP